MDGPTLLPGCPVRKALRAVFDSYDHSHKSLNESLIEGNLFMSTKSTPGDGQHGKGSKGLPVGEPHRGAVAFVKELAQGVRGLRRR